MVIDASDGDAEEVEPFADPVLDCRVDALVDAVEEAVELPELTGVRQRCAGELLRTGRCERARAGGVVSAEDAAEIVTQAAELRSRAHLVDYDIPDPYQRGPEAQAEAAALMAEAVERIAKGLDR